VALLAASGCTASAPATTTPSDGKPQVIASIYPLMYVTQQVAGDLADVVVLTPITAEPHDYELTPRQMASLTGAELVVYQQGVDAAVDEAVAGASPGHVIETGSLVRLMPANGEDTAEYASSGSGAAYLYDPHTWLDPTNMATFATAIADELASLDPADAAGYQANADAFNTQMTSLDDEITAGLTNCRTTTFMTTHAAFGYFAARYGLTQLAIAGISPDDEPSPRQLGELSLEAAQNGLTTVFYETMVSPDYAKTMAYDLGLKTDVLDPIEGVTAQSRGDDYLAIQRSNLAALRQANGCS
jgi:zinc transport system substrate-binding protein